MTAVLARNFPASWVAPTALEVLPQKVQSLLQRLGPLDGPPVITQTPSGLQAHARFQSASDARAAVQTLNGFDMRTPTEKEAANHQAPKESERFSLRIADEEGASVVAPQTSVVPKAPPRKRKIKTNGIILWPLPNGWAENDVILLASPYGAVQRTRVEAMANGQKGALIDYHKDAAASAAQSALNGLTLMGIQLRCTMQEEPEPAKPLQLFVLYIDELEMSSLPNQAEPKLDNREVFITGLPRHARSEDGARAWLSSFGEVEEVFLLRTPQTQKSTGKAYARFKSFSETASALEAIRSSSSDEGVLKARWSESERSLQGTRSSYGLDVLRHLAGEGGKQLLDIRKAASVPVLSIESNSGNFDGTSSGSRHVHFVARCPEQSQAEECWRLMSAALARVHEMYSREVRGSLVLRGFPASWSEKGLKFVFAPFGGLASVAIEDEEKDALPFAAAGEVASSGRLAYVKLRNAQGTEKAVTNLHQTKVGDGDLVEECVVACHRWHTSSWSDGTFLVGIFIDQLAMGRRPAEVGPGPEDRELFVRNLPLQDMTPQQLQEYFEGFGEVDDLHLIRDPFTSESTNEGYVRFKHHKDAVRCIEALTPTDPAEADPTDLAGSWSESERVLQRKANCYKFNLVAELVGADGSGLERIKAEAKLKGLWLLGETLQLKDRSTPPPPSGRQLHFVGRCAEEQHARLFRDLLEKALEVTHTKIASRLDKRKQKESGDGGGQNSKAEPLAHTNGQAYATGSWQPPPAQPPAFWGASAAPPAMGGPFDAYQVFPPAPFAVAPTGSAWAQPVAQATSTQVSVFEQEVKAASEDRRSSNRQENRKSRSRRRRHRSEAEGNAPESATKDRRRRSGSRKRRRRGAEEHED